jgi:hypothetical protein
MATSTNSPMIQNEARKGPNMGRLAATFAAFSDCLRLPEGGSYGEAWHAKYLSNTC